MSTAEQKDGPRACCLNQNNLEERATYPGGAGTSGSWYYCAGCDREFLLAHMDFDESCMDPMHYELWRLLPAGEKAPETATNLSDYIMQHKPYYARNVAAGGEFRLSV